MSWIVRRERYSSYWQEQQTHYVNGMRYSSGTITFNMCERGNDAHQFETKAAAEAIAFMFEGEALEYDPKEHNS